MSITAGPASEAAPSQIRPQLKPPSDFTVWQLFLQRFGLEGIFYSVAGASTFRFTVDVRPAVGAIARYEVLLKAEGGLPYRATINGRLYAIDAPEVEDLIRAMEYGGQRPPR